MANLNVYLPDDVYQRLKERAEGDQQTIEAKVRDIVTAAITDDAIPADLEADLEALKTADDATLWHVAETNRLSRRESKEIEELHFKRGRGEALTTEERLRLAAGMLHYNRAMLMRAEAAALLKERGHNIDKLLLPV